MRIALLSIALLLAGCSTPNDQPLSPYFGDAVRRNMMAHIINPTPLADASDDPGMDGHRAAGAYDRYQTAKVKQPRSLSTSSLSAQNSTGK